MDIIWIVFILLFLFFRGFLLLVFLALSICILLLVLKILIRIIIPNKNLLQSINTPPTIQLINNHLMKYSYFVIPLAGILMWAFAILEAWYQSGTIFNFEITSVLTLLILFQLSIIWGIDQWRTLRWSVFIPMLLSILIIVISFPSKIQVKMCNKIIDLRLEHNLPQYNQLIETIQAGKVILDKDNRIQLLESFPAVWVSDYRSDAGDLQVRFMTGGYGVGDTHHWGYFYIANDSTFQKSLWVNRKIKPHWYWFQD